MSERTNCFLSSMLNGQRQLKYSAVTDKVEGNCHFSAPGRNCCDVGKLFCFYGAMLDSYWENLVALGSESCSSCWESGSDSCVQLYQ
jgi:hypothetical protein